MQLARFWRWAIVTGAALALAACSHKADKGGLCDGAPSATTCLTDHYLLGYQAAPIDLCKSASTAKVHATKEIGFFLGPGVIDLEAQTAGRRLQRYYEAYALSFYVRHEAGSVGFQYLLSGTEDAVRARAKELGVNPDKQTTQEEADKFERVVGEVLAKNLRDTIVSRGTAVDDRIDIVVVDGIVDPAVQKIVAGEGVILGMGLSPKLFREILAADPTADYFSFYGIPRDFTPVFFVGQDDVRRLTPDQGDAIMAHEMGHALGLVHVEEQENLMFPVAGTVPCTPGLSDAQVLELARGSTPGDARPTSEVPTLARITKAYAAGLRKQMRRH